MVNIFLFLLRNICFWYLLEASLFFFPEISKLFTCLELRPEPASIPQSDVHLTGDQVMGSIPGGSGYILSWRLILKCFRLSFSLCEGYTEFTFGAFYMSLRLITKGLLPKLSQEKRLGKVISMTLKSVDCAVKLQTNQPKMRIWKTFCLLNLRAREFFCRFLWGLFLPILTYTTHWAYLAGDKLMRFFLCFPENSI